MSKQPAKKAKKRKPTFMNVGQLEAICKTIRNKEAVVLLSDKKGMSPERAVHTMVIYDDSHKVEELVIAGGFLWGEVDDDEEGLEDQEEPPLRLEDIQCLGEYFEACMGPDDCVEPHPAIKLLEPNENAAPTTTK